MHREHSFWYPPISFPTFTQYFAGFPRDTFLNLVGEYYFDYIQRTGHDELMRNLGENMLQFLENLDYVHTYMMSEYPDINMPSFHCETDSVKDRMTLHYYSFRTGLYPVVIGESDVSHVYMYVLFSIVSRYEWSAFIPGVLRAVAKTYFKSELKIDVISDAIETVSEAGSTREHVVLSISVTQAQTKADEAPPTFVAQTNKNAEKQIKKLVSFDQESLWCTSRKLCDCHPIYSITSTIIRVAHKYMGNISCWGNQSHYPNFFPSMG